MFLAVKTRTVFAGVLRHPRTARQWFQSIMLASVESESHSGDALPACLWKENSYGLVSLWDIVRNLDLSRIVGAAWILSTIEGHVSSPWLMGEPLDPERTTAVLSALAPAGNLCRELGLVISLEAIERLSSSLTTPLTGQVGWRVQSDLKDILFRLQAEMKACVAFRVPSERSKYYDQGDGTNLFGERVDEAFPSVKFDVREAGNCFALARYTACVFHLMRVLETGLAVLAKRFAVVSDHANWHNIIEGIEKAVRNMSNDPNRPSDWKEQQEFASQAAIHFMFVKDGWRNYTAHARGKYTDEEAEIILMNVRGFMQKLAARLHE